MDKIVAEARSKAAEGKKAKNVWNREAYKLMVNPRIVIGELQEALPTIYETKRQFDAIREAMPSLNATDYGTYDLLREQNTVEPIKNIRLELFKTQRWYAKKLNDTSAGVKQFDRIKQALEAENLQLVQAIRLEGDGRPLTAALLTTCSRNIDEITDAMDEFLELFPKEERDVAQTLIDSKPAAAVLATKIAAVRARQAKGEKIKMEDVKKL